MPYRNLDALLDDVDSLQNRLSSGSDAIATMTTGVYELESRLGLVRLRVAFLEAVMDMIVHTGAWAVVQVLSVFVFLGFLSKSFS